MSYNFYFDHLLQATLIYIQRCYAH